MCRALPLPLQLRTLVIQTTAVHTHLPLDLTEAVGAEAEGAEAEGDDMLLQILQ